MYCLKLHVQGSDEEQSADFVADYVQIYMFTWYKQQAMFQQGIYRVQNYKRGIE